MLRWLLIILCAIPLTLQAQVPSQRPRVGVVLSGGGAKGVAHIAVLRTVEDAGIPIDYIVGTSMGAIIGGLYAMGYSTTELDSLVRTSDWNFLLSDRPPRKELSPNERERYERFVLNIPLRKAKKPEIDGFVRGRNLGNMLAQLTVGYHDSISFDSLPIPFTCVATNLANGEEVDIHSGIPATAIRASMAIPGVFTPVVQDGCTLVDGGLVNNFPVDVARRMGADIVIGSTVQRAFADTMQTGGMQGVINQLVSISSRRKFEENIKDCDVHIGVNAQGIGTMEFTPAAIDTMMRRGEAEARAHWQELQHIAAITHNNHAIRPNDSTTFQPQILEQNAMKRATLKKSITNSLKKSFPISEVLFDRITVAEERIIRQACGIVDYSLISQEQIEQAVRILSERFLYLDANYSLANDGNKYRLTFHARQRMASQVGIGGRFDTEELAVLLLGANFVFHTHVPSYLDITARLGEQYGAQANFSIEPSLGRQLNIFYDFWHKDIDIYHNGSRSYNIEYMQHLAGVSFAIREVRNFDFEIGAQFSYYKFSNVLSSNAASSSGIRPKDDVYYTGFAKVSYNSQNRNYYPTRGAKFFAEYNFTTDNLGHFKHPHAFSSVMAQWENVLPLNKHLAIQPRVAGRLVLSQDAPYVFINTIGGYQRGKYIAQQLPFIGFSHMEAVRNALLMADLCLRYNIIGHHYATLLGALAAEQRDLKHLNHAKYIYGIGLRYGYDSKFGPIEAAISYSGNCTKPFLYLNIGFDF